MFDNLKWGRGDDEMPDKEELLERTREAMRMGQEWMGKLGRQWQGDTPNDALARELVAAGTMLISGLVEACEAAGEDPKSVNPLILALSVQAFENHMRTLAMLNSLGSLTGKDDASEDFRNDS
jgi:hypothetical protein